MYVMKNGRKFYTYLLEIKKRPRVHLVSNTECNRSRATLHAILVPSTRPALERHHPRRADAVLAQAR